MGSFHAANVGCLKAYREGIGRTVEVMVPCPWFDEAVNLLAETPGVDVGIHLVLSSEWRGLRWRPLTPALSLVDADGYFLARTFPDVKGGYPKEKSLNGWPWKIAEIEAEFRAQIETARRRIPCLSHLSGHMGIEYLDPAIRQLLERLAKEYGLPLSLTADRAIDLFDGKQDKEARVAAAVAGLKALPPGAAVQFVVHPGMDGDEMRGVGKLDGTEVAVDRGCITDVLTDPRVVQAVKDAGIVLESIAEAQADERAAAAGR
jgi:predicted glycoside hydrolase/deacetylase ChbG (UPF0249 family)